MKNLFLILLSFCFAVILNSQVVAQRPSAVFKKAIIAPVIDGVVDAVWNDATAYNIERHVGTQTPTIGAPGETTWKGLWTLDGVYILLQVTDNAFYPNYVAGTGLNDWEYDKFELYFDVNYVLEDGKGPATSNSGHPQFAPGFKLNQNNGTVFTANDGVKNAFMVVGSHYIAEYFIPYTKLIDVNGNQVNKSNTIGFDVTVIDRDPGDLTRSIGVWSNQGAVGESWANMDDAGRVTFEGAEPLIYVDAINLNTGGTITVDNGTLQMVANITPEDATNKQLKWTITNGTGQAIIDQTGLVKAIRNGTVSVKAVAMDGSWVEAMADVVISGQQIDKDDIWNSMNLIQNWNFNDGLTSWGGWVDNEVAGQVPPVVVNGVAVMKTGIATDGYNWHYQHNQNALQAEANIPYILQFKSWASADAPAALDFEDVPNDFNRYGVSTDPEAINGRSEWQYNLTTEPTWFTFHVTFDQILPTTDQKVQWMLSRSNETIYLDSIRLVRESDYFTIDPALLDAFEPDNTPGSSSVITPGVTQEHSIYPVGDVDYASFEIASPSWVQINFATVSGSQQLQLLAPDGSTVLAQMWSYIGMTLVQPGKYYIRAWNPDNQLIVSYQLSLNISPVTLVSSITLTGGSTITTDNGTLQMVAHILPNDASNQNIAWSVKYGTGRASIDANGLLTAQFNGTVTVKAKALDGSGIEGSAVVTIIAQVMQLPDLEIIKNGQFITDGGLPTPWGWWSLNGGFEPQVVNGVAVCNPGSIIGNVWEYQFNQLNLTAMPNIEYVFSFTAWADAPRPIDVDFEDTSENGYNRYGASSDPNAINGRSDWNFNLTTVPTTYTFHVNFDQMLPNTIQKVQFMLGSNPVVAYIDHVSLVSVNDLLLLNLPLANAGSDQSVNEGVLVTLDGSSSSDPNSNPLMYSWTAPAGITLSSTTDSKPTFTAPEVLVDTDYTFSLVVNDGTLTSTADQVVVTVKVNNPPLANAGPNQSVNEGVLVTLDGSSSSDPNSNPLMYGWTAPAGITLSSTTDSKPTFTAPEVLVNTDYTFSLVVNDGTTNSAADQVTITVNNVGSPAHFIPVWTNNGFDHMNINIYSATLDGVELEAGDEIGIFDGNLCVGVGSLTGPITTTNTLNLAVSKNDGSGNGYTSGNAISYKLFDRSNDMELSNVTAIYDSGDASWSTDGMFAIGVTAFAELTGVTSVNQDIILNTGWNIISTNVVPDNLNLKDIFQALIDGGTLKKVMDETGKTIENFGSFGGWKNTIGNLNSTKGYKVNVTALSTLSLEGMPVPLPMDISLNTGWNIISYPASNLQDAKEVVQALIDAGKLKKVMDETGKTVENFGSFGGWKNSIGNFTPGKGYKVSVTESCILNIPVSGTKSAVIVPEVLASEHFKPVFMGNGTDHMNVNLVNLQASGLRENDQIGVFDGKLCVGSVTIGTEQLMAGSISIAASSNDEPGEAMNGFTTGHRVELQLYRGNQAYQLTLANVSGNQSFEKNESLFAQVNTNELTAIQILDESAQFKCYPNPFTKELTIEVQNSNQADITVEIYNMAGQRIKGLFKGNNQEHLLLKWRGTNDSGQQVAPGVYLCKVNGQSKQVVYEGENIKK